MSLVHHSRTSANKANIMCYLPRASRWKPQWKPSTWCCMKMQVKMPLFLILILILIFYYNMRAIHLFYQLLASSPSGPLSRPPFAVPTTELMANAGAPEGTREGKFPRAGKDPYCKPNFARKLRHRALGSVLPAALASSQHHGCRGVGDRLAYPGHEWWYQRFTI